ncbi:MAG: DUF721 domain-containing protein [Chloroflexota bacterium]
MSAAPRGRGRIGRPLAEIVLKQLDPLVARQGFGQASLLMQWPEIVGARVAGLCAPERLQWPARGRKPSPDRPQEPATLVLRVEPGFGLEIQHMGPAIIERVNAHLGWRCVARLTLRQQALPTRAAQRPRPARPDPAARAQAQTATDGVEDAALRAALIRLGERALAPQR